MEESNKHIQGYLSSFSQTVGVGGSTCTCGANSSGWFDGHVVPPQTGPQEPQHQAHTSQRLHRLQAIPGAQARGVVSSHHSVLDGYVYVHFKLENKRCEEKGFSFYKVRRWMAEHLRLWA